MNQKVIFWRLRIEECTDKTEVTSMKTEVDEDHVVEISDDINKEDNSEEYVTVHGDDTLKDMKQDESEVNYTNKWEDANDKIEPEKITRQGRVPRRPKEYENYKPC